MAATKSAPTHPELRQAAEALATPIDFDQLIEDGVLRKTGSWYEVVDPARLPEHARLKIKALKAGNRVKFRKPSKRLGKFLRSLAPAENGTPTEPEPEPVRPRSKARS
jgi:hypothetical protein